ncbi:hypothetical protein PybrP1_005908 [[Pythium] brassicae (nom. inval.)]|nr:hypothetical protein PybrP1_005908 [[Pythium] brassicae (nom. inval.)]
MRMQPPPSSDEELALKQHVTAALASQGVLGKIKAQLRAAVFHVMHEHEPDEELAGAAHRLRGFGRDGVLALELVLDFFALLELEHSLAVLTAEAGVDARDTRSRSDARDRLEKLGLRAKGELPLLIQLVQQPRGLLERTDRSEAADAHAQQGSNGFGLRDDDRARSARQEESWIREQPQAAKISADRAPGVSTRHSDLADDARDASRLELNDKKSGGPVDRVESDGDANEIESVASASELDESIAEEQSASLNYSLSASRDDASHDGSDGSARDDDAEELVTRQKGAAASPFLTPPPVPIALSPLPLLTAPNAKATQHDDDEFDEEFEAARLSSLDAKLKAMEAEDETGTLQQLKATLQMELQQDDESLRSKSDGGAVVGGATDDEEPDGYGYGSDFEEEEVISDVSDDDEIESVAGLSENDASDSLSSLQPTGQRSKATDDEDEDEDAPPLAALRDKAVDDENALNSYDYIEDVERD